MLYLYFAGKQTRWFEMPVQHQRYVGRLGVGGCGGFGSEVAHKWLETVMPMI